MWGVYQSYETVRRQAEVERHALRELAILTSQFNELIWFSSYNSGDGWRARTEEELFSEETANAICRLDPHGAAPYIPAGTWESHLSGSFKAFVDSLDTFLTSYGTMIDSRLVRPLSSLRRNGAFRLVVSTAEVDFQALGMRRLRPGICEGFENMLIPALDDLRQVNSLLRQQSDEIAEAIGKPWIRQGDRDAKNKDGPEWMSP